MAADAQQRRQFDARRRAEKPWRAWYGTPQWKKLRAHQLRQEPLCRMCKDMSRIVAASVADHKIPHKGDAALFFDAQNLQSLCATHHNSTKARDEARGRVTGADMSGVPIDPNHHWNS